MILDSLLLSSVLDVFIVVIAAAGIALCVRYARRPVFQTLRLELGAIITGLAIWLFYHGFDLSVIIFGPLFMSVEEARALSGMIHNDLRFFTDMLAAAVLAFGFLRLLSRVSEIYAALSRSADDLKEEIGSRDRAEEELLATANRQREHSRSKSEFLVAISHELRTPLNGILGLASLLSNTGLGDDQRRLLTTLEQSAKAMLSLVSDVLDLARLESGQTELRTVLFNPAELATSVEALFQPFATDKQLRIVAEAAGTADCTVIGDQQLVRQALSNLVSNAIKYSPTGEVRIITRVAGGDAERLWLEYEIHDTGIGIDAAIAERLARVSGSVNQGEVGLGLAICWHIARLMDGSVALERLEAGTRALLRVQVQREPEPDEDAEPI